MKLIIKILLVSSFFLLLGGSVKAECTPTSPGYCTEAGECASYEHCTANCCVGDPSAPTPPPGGGGGGGGGSNPSCPAGTTLTCYSPPVYRCVSLGACRVGRFPSMIKNFADDGCEGTDVNCWINCACVANCTNTDPAAVVLTSPANGANLTGTMATLLWNGTTSWGTACSGKNLQYQVIMDTNTVPSTVVQTISGTTPSTPPTTTSSTRSSLVAGTTYYWKIRTLNGPRYMDSEIRHFTMIDDEVPGTVYYNDDPTSCDPNVWTGGGTVTATGGPGTYSATINPDGTYTMNLPTGTYTLSLTNLPAGYTCSTYCSTTGCDLTGINPGDPNNNFYITPSRAAWWQVAGGNVYAGSTLSQVNVRSLVPPSHELIIDGGLGSVGLLMRAAGSVSYNSTGGTLSSANWSAVSRYMGKRMDYAFFAAREGLTSSKTSDWVADSLNQQTADARDFWYMKPSGTTATVETSWSVLSGEKYVVFVDGNLAINSNITVANGGFLTFIVKGNITVNSTVTDIQGIYIADGIFSSGSNGATDVQLEVQGTTVAWSGVNLVRDLDTNNSVDPGEIFKYRPDLIVNMPSKMRVYALEWTEVPAGTFNSNISN